MRLYFSQPCGHLDFQTRIWDQRAKQEIFESMLYLIFSTYVAVKPMTMAQGIGHKQMQLLR